MNMKIELENEHLKSLQFWYNAALEKLPEGEKEFHKMLIYGWHVDTYPEEDELLSIFKSAKKTEIIR